MNMFEEIKSAMSLAPAIIKIVKELIQAVEIPGHGEEKKKAVLDVTKAIWNASNNYVPLPPWSWAEPIVNALIEAVVTIWNAVGHLEKVQNKPAGETKNK